MEIAKRKSKWFPNHIWTTSKYGNFIGAYCIYTYIGAIDGYNKMSEFGVCLFKYV